MTVKITSDTARNNSTLSGFLQEAKQKVIERNRREYKKYENDNSVEGKTVREYYRKALLSIS